MSHTPDLFAGEHPAAGERRALGEQAWLLHGFALPWVDALLPLLLRWREQAPLRHWRTPGGGRMAVGSTNCGALGWVSDAAGYRYSPFDPHTGRPWPVMPQVLVELAQAAAAAAGFAGFRPDACLLNHYPPGVGMGLHQDRDEHVLRAPIVSLSLGLPALFLWGGARRSDTPVKVPLRHGDAVVWGGPDRLRFHGVAPVAEGVHPQLGARRINLTLRLAG